MARVLGIGGIFFKSPNPQELQAWYHQHLNVESDPDGYVTFQWRDKQDPNKCTAPYGRPFPATPPISTPPQPPT